MAKATSMNTCRYFQNSFLGNGSLREGLPTPPGGLLPLIQHAPSRSKLLGGHTYSARSNLRTPKSAWHECLHAKMGLATKHVK